MKNTLFAIFIIFCAVLPSHAAEVTVAAASDLSFAMKDIIADFEKTTGNKVRLSLGSSWTFATQISNGASVNVFLSADIGCPQNLSTSNS
jgi:molybdate transport system substrate-binding protein